MFKFKTKTLKTICLMLAIVMVALGTIPVGAVDKIDVNRLKDISSLEIIDQRVTSVVEERISTINADIEISNIRSATDFAGNLYKVIECDPIGYFIIHVDSGHIIEYSPSSFSPYINIDYSENIVYGGPKNYYSKTEVGYNHSVFEDVFYSVDEVQPIIEYNEQVNAHLLNQPDERISNYLNGVDDLRGQNNLISPNTTNSNTISALASVSWVDSYTWIRNLSSSSDFGYVSGGYCGFIAGNILLRYYDYLGYLRLWSGYKSGTALTDRLIEIGKDQYGLTASSGTVGWDIADVINYFWSYEGSGYTGRATWALGSSGVKNSIVSDRRPAILFGSIGAPNGGSGGNHAVLAYGFTQFTSGIISYDVYVCHYGWSNYSEVYIMDFLWVVDGGADVSGTFGTNTRYIP